jgi:transposase InsO family protein
MGLVGSCLMSAAAESFFLHPRARGFSLSTSSRPQQKGHRRHAPVLELYNNRRRHSSSAMMAPNYDDHTTVQPL